MAQVDTEEILRRLDEYRQQYGLVLDMGCGGADRKQEGAFGIDQRDLPGVDLVWNLEDVPYPLPDEIAQVIVASHIVEHINPHGGKFIDVMNEWWRLLKVGGKLLIATPYGTSMGYLQDPTHCNPCIESTFAYFDPEATRDGELWRIYRPKPWRLEDHRWRSYGNLEVVLQKRALDWQTALSPNLVPLGPKEPGPSAGGAE